MVWQSAPSTKYQEKGEVMRNRTSWIMVLLGMLLALALVPAASAQGNALVRVVHASPDAPAVDVYVDGNKALSNVPFFTASDYLPLPAGEHRFQVTPTGQPAASAVIDARATVEAGKAYTVAATGKVAEIKPTILADNLSAPAAGKAHVRVVHASPDAPAVDIKVKGGAALIPNLAFPKDSGYMPVDAGSYDLTVNVAGTDTVALDLAGTRLEAGKIYDIFAVGLLGNNTLAVQVTTPPPAAAAAAPAAPSNLPNTAGETLPVALFALMAALLVGGGLALRRRAR
jgi:LPXTG-motif cell wall-anchored protein